MTVFIIPSCRFLGTEKVCTFFSTQFFKTYLCINMLPKGIVLHFENESYLLASWELTVYKN